MLQLVAISEPPVGRTSFQVRQQIMIARSSGLELIDRITTTNAKRVTALIAATAAEPFQRVTAVEKLGKIGADAKPALPTLTMLKLDSDTKVREAATKAIEAIKAE